MWNRNDVALVSLIAPDQGGATAYQQSRTRRQHAISGDLLFYFRRRDSWVRPYLSAGFGVDFLRSEEEQVTNARGSAAGIELSLGRGFQFRYSFAETIQGNEFSR